MHSAVQLCPVTILSAKKSAHALHSMWGMYLVDVLQNVLMQACL